MIDQNDVGMTINDNSDSNTFCNESCGGRNHNFDSRFSCNICLDAVVEPVVTRCGHLYCWPCLFTWLEPGMLPEERESLGMAFVYNPNNSFGGDNDGRRNCPVCKSVCSVSTLVPLYVRSANSSSSASSCSTNQILPSSAGSSNGQGEYSSIDNSDLADGNNGNIERGENSIVDSEDESSLYARRNGGVEEGLRQRRRHQRQHRTPQECHQEQQRDMVPNRPSAISPQQHRHQASSPRNSITNNNSSLSPIGSSSNPYHITSVGSNGGWITPRSPNGHNGSLTQGILSSFRSSADYYRSEHQQQQQQIPSLHDRRSNFSDSNSGGLPGEHQQGGFDVYSETTQYLSRLLIMLASFVILCLLLV